MKHKVLCKSYLKGCLFMNVVIFVKDGVVQRVSTDDADINVLVVDYDSCNDTAVRVLGEYALIDDITVDNDPALVAAVNRLFINIKG